MADMLHFSSEEKKATGTIKRELGFLITLRVGGWFFIFWPEESLS